MLRVYLPIIFFAVFIAWALYQLLIKKELKQNLTTLYVGLTFTVIWGLIYYFMLRQ